MRVTSVVCCSLMAVYAKGKVCRIGVHLRFRLNKYAWTMSRVTHVLPKTYYLYLDGDKFCNMVALILLIKFTVTHILISASLLNV